MPTFRRPQKLKRCLKSICNEIDRLNLDCKIHVSNNECTDIETKYVTINLEKTYVIYHENAVNIGIDANHDLIFDYCKEYEYVVLLADDDFLPYGSLEKLFGIFDKEFLFAVCNSKNMVNGIANDKPLFNGKGNVVLNKVDSVKFFSYNRPLALLPMIPFFGGIVVNMREMKLLSSKVKRISFSGTFHQYIGSLWNALFESDKDLKVCVANDVVLGNGADDDKTWYEYKDDVYANLCKFYESLNVNKQIKKDLLFLYKYPNGIKGRMANQIVKIRSMRWQI